MSIKGIRLVEPAVINSDGGDSAAPDVSYYFSIFSFELYSSWVAHQPYKIFIDFNIFNGINMIFFFFFFKLV